MPRWIALALCIGCAAQEGPVALMTPGDLRTMPWPSDALLGMVTPPFPFDGNEDNLARLGQALSELDGFGTTTSVFFPVSDDVIVDPGAAAQVIDLDGDDPPRSFPLMYRAETKQLIAMIPTGTVLREQHHYQCVIGSGVHDAAGHPLRPAPAMKTKALASTVFTTQSESAWAMQVLSDLDAMPPSATVTRTFSGAELDTLFGGPVTTTLPGLPPSGGVLHDQIGLVIEGTFQSPNYLSNPPGQLGLFDGTVKSMDAIPFLLALPKNATGKVPVVIFQHGIGSDRSAILLVANDYAAHGYATFGIDELWHGSRQPGAVDQINNISGAMAPDGIGDPGGGNVTNFFDIAGDSSRDIAALDPRVMRDNFRQATIDLIQSARLARTLSVNGVNLDGSKLVYTGESFGSILGAQVMALDPDSKAAVLDVGGGGLFLDLIGNSASFAQLLQPFVAGGFDQLVDVNHPDVLPIHAQMSLNLMQTLMEPGDGLALAPAASADKSILFLEAYNDEVVSNHSTEALATAWGATQVMLPSGSPPTRVVDLPKMNAPMSGNPLRALVQLDPACHGMFTRQKDSRKYEDGFPPFMKRATPLSVDNPIARAHALALGFIEGFRAGTPTVPSE